MSNQPLQEGEVSPYGSVMRGPSRRAAFWGPEPDYDAWSGRFSDRVFEPSPLLSSGCGGFLPRGPLSLQGFCAPQEPRLPRPCFLAILAVVTILQIGIFFAVVIATATHMTQSYPKCLGKLLAHNPTPTIVVNYPITASTPEMLQCEVDKKGVDATEDENYCKHWSFQVLKGQKRVANVTGTGEAEVPHQVAVSRMDDLFVYMMGVMFDEYKALEWALGNGRVYTGESWKKPFHKLEPLTSILKSSKNRAGVDSAAVCKQEVAKLQKDSMMTTYLVLLLLCLPLTMILHVVVALFFRKAFRRAYSMKENCCEDTLLVCACYPCTICQELRHTMRSQNELNDMDPINP
ncbi:unnamed protein product [Vitrella brassicaformis CCMP3155]|uniref:Uncharacterized protein n=1 Tax=Vitrella brassicaformis (strain CCMP3155) TaxID=1169540 RepID=A0A0G4GMP9_VITBC|nr:unnamed protein product [Vitrella brassicaformis CCMP3155]|eukprot:CEM31405.1 unnamed protein product [Vitrella brassicaformis CCMP3155]